MTNKRHYIETVGLVAGATALGVGYPKVEVIMGFQGAIVGSLVVYILPGAFGR